MKPAAQSLTEEDQAELQPAKRRGRPRKDTAPQAMADAETENGGGDDLPATVDPRNKLNDLTAKEWIPETVSVWN